jgi:flavin-dependent dehydrogenase
MKGYAYYLFAPAHLAAAARVDPDGKGGAYLCGDSLGLAQPLTAEGILPAVISGRLCAEAILAGAPASYPARLAAHPVIDDYPRVYRLREAAAALARPSPTAPRDGRAPRSGRRRSRSAARVSGRAIATGFAWMFSGARLPAPKLIDLALAVGEKWSRYRQHGRAA